jgi:hypothetical protein
LDQVSGISVTQTLFMVRTFKILSTDYLEIIISYSQSQLAWCPLLLKHPKGHSSFPTPMAHPPLPSPCLIQILMKSYMSMFMISVLISFPSLWQNTWGNLFMRIYFGSQFQVFQPIVVWLALGLWKHTHDGRSTWQRSLLTLPHGDQETMRERETGVPVSPSREFPPMIQLPSTRTHISKTPPPPNSSTGWGPNLQFVIPWGTFQIQTIAVSK